MSPAPSATLNELLQRAHSPHSPCDDESRQLIHQAWSERPDAVCAIVQRALGLEGELAAARAEIAQLKQRPLAAAHGSVLPSAVRDPVASGVARAGQGSAGWSWRPSGDRTFEDVGARFFANHVGKAWIALLLLATVIVLVQEQLV